MSDAPNDEKGLPPWIVTFADLMTLLMCFYVLMLSFSEMDVAKFKQTVGLDARRSAAGRDRRAGHAGRHEHRRAGVQPGAARADADEQRQTVHTDDMPIATSRFRSNWDLSAARAASVAHELLAAGVDPARLMVSGHADTQPRAPRADSRADNAPIARGQGTASRAR